LEMKSKPEKTVDCEETSTWYTLFRKVI